ncbi:antibiotic biosynthesis monooxygenase family protein [Nocardia tengchongensis]|uniref:antibiotic biosynthesis monooxygenase family protein n=1 Tax=Nocardia tengchongensis TaxID=2055889 RepID=UPI003688F9B1
MYARSTTLQAQLSALESGIAHVRDEVMPELEGIPGCIGLSLLVDRKTGRCIVTTSWDSEDALRASAAQVMPIRNRAAEKFGGSPTVEEWEIAAMHRAHPAPQGACARVTWVKTDPSRLGSAIEVYRDHTLPGMEQQLDGFCSASLMVNRSSGRAVSCSVYDDAEAMERNRIASAALRVDAARQARVEAVDVREFELVLAHLRVPELV